MTRAYEKPPAFQFYVKSWLSSTKHMSLEAKGAYIDLMAWSWDNGPLPLAEPERARLIGVTPAQFRRAWPVISSKWQRVDAGFVNLRLEQQRAELEAHHEKAIERGAKGASARWSKHAQSIDQASTKHAPSIAYGVLSDSSSSSTASSSTKDQDPELRQKRANKPSEYSPEFSAFWRQYPRRVKKDAAFAAWTALGPDDGLQGAIASALEWQVNQPAWLEDAGKWVPHPASWLNGRRWEDEPFTQTRYAPDTRTKGGRTVAAAMAASDMLAGKLLTP